MEVNEILRRVEFSPMKGKLKGQWRARFLSGGAVTTGKTKEDVAMNIITNGKKINKKLVRLMSDMLNGRNTSRHTLFQMGMQVIPREM